MSSTRLVVLSLALLVACSQAFAQMGGMRHGQGGGGRQHQGNDDLSGVTRLSANDQVRMHLTDLRLALKLRPEQNPLFDAYQNKVFEVLADLGRPGPAADEPALKLIDRRVEAARGRVALLEDLSGAAKTLYASLDDEQKKSANRIMSGTVP
ncbi:MAG: hypothetical protein ACRET8_05115 [Burkholderiales bacterium]